MSDLQRVIKCIDWLIFERKVKSRRDLAEKMDYTESSMSQILNAKVSLSSRFIKKLSKIDPDISESWLMSGKGEMLKNNEQNVNDIANSTVVGASVNGNGNNITNNDVSELIELQKGYQEILKSNQMQLSRSQDQIDKLIELLSKK